MQTEVYQCPVTKQFYDPFAVLRRLHSESAGKVNEWLKGQGDPETYGKLVALGRSVFALPAIDPRTGKGTLEPTVVKALEAFSEYARGKGSGAVPSSGLSRASVSPRRSAPKSCSGCP